MGKDDKKNKDDQIYKIIQNAMDDFFSFDNTCRLREELFSVSHVENIFSKYIDETFNASICLAIKSQIKNIISAELADLNSQIVGLKSDFVRESRNAFRDVMREYQPQKTDTYETDRLKKEIDRLKEELQKKQKELESANNINKYNSPTDNGKLEKLNQQIETLENENRILKAENISLRTKNNNQNDNLTKTLQTLESVKTECNRLKKANGSFAEIQDELTTTKAELNEANDKLSKANDELSTTKSELSTTKNELNSTKAELIETKSELSSTKNELNSTKAELIETKSELSSTKSELSTTKNELSTTKAELSVTKNELSMVKSELNSTKSELSTAKNELSTTKNELNSAKAELSVTKNELSTVKSELNSTKSELSEIKNDFVRTETKLNGYKDATKLYGEIYNYMTECESVKPAFADMGIREPQDNYEDLPHSERIKFITHFSPDYGFARIIYNALDNYKNKEHIPITEQEQQLISAVNDYYRRLLGKSSYDALDYLDIIKNNSHGKETDFRRQSMKSLTEPRRTDFYTVKDIYVPALRRPDDGSIDRKAIVEAE